MVRRQIPAPPKEGSMRLWVVVNIPNPPDRHPVNDAWHARSLLHAMADSQLLIPEIESNAFGLEVYRGGEWEEWEDKHGRNIGEWNPFEDLSRADIVETFQLAGTLAASCPPCPRGSDPVAWLESVFPKDSDPDLLRAAMRLTLQDMFDLVNPDPLSDP